MTLIPCHISVILPSHLKGFIGCLRQSEEKRGISIGQQEFGECLLDRKEGESIQVRKIM